MCATPPVRHCPPAKQNTNYVALLNEWAVGFYTELDFLNEASNQMQMKELMKVVPGALSAEPN